jgi:hypothetical protein
MNVNGRAMALSLALVGVFAAGAAGQGMFNMGPPVAPTTRMVQRWNPATGQYEWVGVPAAGTVNPGGAGSYLDPATGLYPYPGQRPTTSPGPYPGYPYVAPNPYPGGNVGTLPAPAGGQVPQRQIPEWYGRYLRRQVDQAGMNAHVQAYYRGGPESALAGILGSQEYYRLWGNDPRRFVAGLYSDVLHRQPRANELNQWASQVGRRTLTQIAYDFLIAARQELGGPYY